MVSSVTIESEFYEVYTVLLEALSEDYFQEIIERGSAKYLPLDHENFERVFNQILKEKGVFY